MRNRAGTGNIYSVTIPARISVITLGVSDLALSTLFYESIGWRRAATSDGSAATFMITADSVLGLVPFDALAADANLPTEGRLHFCGVALTINLESERAVDLALADAVAAGGSLLRPARHRRPDGYSGYFGDPDGYPWEVAHRPDLTIGPDGSLDLPAEPGGR